MLELLASFHDTAISIRCADRDTYLGVRELFRHVPASGRSTNCPTLSVRTGDRYSTVELPDGTEERVPNVEVSWFLRKKTTAYWIDQHPQFLWLHAGAVEAGGRAVLFAGPAGSGKSTLAVACAESGWRYLCDDVLAIEPGTRRIHPVPFPPEWRTSYAESMTRTEFLIQRKARWEAGAPPPPDEPARLDELAFIQYEPDLAGAPVREPLNPVEAASALVAQSFGSRQRHREIIAAIMGLLKQTPSVYRLRYRDARAVAGDLGQRHGIQFNQRAQSGSSP